MVRKWAKLWVTDRLGLTRPKSNLLERDVNLLSVSNPGPAGHANSRDGMLAPYAPPATPPANPVFSSVASYLQTEIPVFVPCFNNPTYTERMLSQLRRLGFRQIVLMDGGFSYPPMQHLLATPREGVSVVRLPDNPGPKHLVRDPAAFSLLPRHFCITDPDLVFNPAMPPDFLGDLAALAAREQVGKAGLALDISDRDAMRDDSFKIGPRVCRIWEWEEQFWQHELEPLRPGGDAVYRATVDTTFALYDKNFFDPEKPMQAVRVAGRFTCRHLPWYRDKELPVGEEDFYRDAAAFSFYFRSKALQVNDSACEVKVKQDAGLQPADDMETELSSAHLTAIYASRSWRYTRPLRMLGRMLGRPPSVDVAPRALALPELKQQIGEIRRSTSWRLAGPPRVISRWIRNR